MKIELTGAEMKVLKVMVGRKKSDRARAKEAGMSLVEMFEHVASLRAKMYVAPNESIKDAAKRLQLTGIS